MTEHTTAERITYSEAELEDLATSLGSVLSATGEMERDIDYSQSGFTITFRFANEVDRLEARDIASLCHPFLVEQLVLQLLNEGGPS